MRAASADVEREATVVSATKGLEEGSLLRMSQVLTSMSRCPVAVLSGPSFAQEVAAGIPTAIVAASTISYPRARRFNNSRSA